MKLKKTGKKKISTMRKQSTKSKTLNKYSASAHQSRARTNPDADKTNFTNVTHKISDIMSEKIQLSAYSVGNSVESIGKKLQKNGYSKIGAQIKKVGDLIENIGNQKDKKTTKERTL